MSILTLLQKSSRQQPLIALAPMAGVSDVPFRQVCENLGADYSITEMAASSPELISSPKNQVRLGFVANSHVKIVQIFGNNPHEMAEAAQYYAGLGADIIDINMGCPAKKVSSKGAGSALLQDIPLVIAILKQVIKHCPVPVTLKTRLGWDSKRYTLREVANIGEDLGIAMLTVHGRTRACRFSGEASYDLIARVKQERQIPIIANGDIDSPEKAQFVLNHTKCDGIMLGRACVGKPWLFSNIKEHLGISEKKINLSSQNLCTIILAHIEDIYQLYGVTGALHARKHIKKYLLELTKSKQSFSEISKIRENQAQYQALSVILKKL